MKNGQKKIIGKREMPKEMMFIIGLMNTEGVQIEEMNFHHLIDMKIVETHLAEMTDETIAKTKEMMIDMTTETMTDTTTNVMIDVMIVTTDTTVTTDVMIVTMTKTIEEMIEAFLIKDLQENLKML